MKSATSRAPRRVAVPHRSMNESRWAFLARDAQVLRALRTGEHATSLREYFGPASYQELVVLAKAAHRMKAGSAAPKVIVLPGIMGSKLEVRAPAGGKPRMLWIDPLNVAHGDLTQLHLPNGAVLRPAGVMLFNYAKLKLMLNCAGYEAEFFPYDWRLGLNRSGRLLADRILRCEAPVALVAHSMGGLVARAALMHLPRRSVNRVILMGVPNRGSFGAVQALCGSYCSVREVAMLDLVHSPEYLAKKIFSSFPGLYQLLPLQPGGATDLYDARNWPRRAARPDQALLDAARAARSHYAAPDDRLRQIIGMNRSTITALRQGAHGFEYRMTQDGDGTVPLASARLRGVPAYYTQELHSRLAANGAVIRACIDLIASGDTRHLLRRRPRIDSQTYWVGDTCLRRKMRGKIDWGRLNSAQRQALMADIGGRSDDAPKMSRHPCRMVNP